MKDESSIVWAVVALAAVYMFMKFQTQSLAIKAQLQQQQIDAQKQAQNNPWLTVPGAISSGLVGVGALMSGFNNLFSDNSYGNTDFSNPADDVYGGLPWTQE